MLTVGTVISELAASSLPFPLPSRERSPRLALPVYG